MDNPGPFQLTKDGNAFAIGAAGTIVGDWIDGFDGILALKLQMALLYGAGGTTITAYVQTSIDQGQTPIDIWAQQFTTAGGVEMVNLSALTPKTTPAAPQNQGLSAGSCVDGILGDRFRLVVVVTGTYTGGTLINVTGIAA